MAKIAKSFVCAFALAAIWLASGCGGNMPMAQPTPTPPPVVTTISPNQVGVPFAGLPTFTLTVNGAGFESASLITWNGSPHSTSFVSDTQLTAFISTSDVFQVVMGPCGATNSCVVKIGVVNSSGLSSNEVDLRLLELPP